MALYDSDTNEYVTPEDLGVTEEEYCDAAAESEASHQAEGHILVNGRRVYAA